MKTIYTSYFAKLKKLPKDIVPIAICGGLPKFYTGLWYKKIAPKYGFFMEWKQTHDNDFYIEHYQKEVLDTLNPDQVVGELYALLSPEDKDKSIALICYEKSEDFCHRHLFADWLNKNGYHCEEYIGD